MSLSLLQNSSMALWTEATACFSTMPPRLPTRPETMPSSQSHPQPPLTLTLPNINSINRMNPNNEHNHLGLHMFGAQPSGLVTATTTMAGSMNAGAKDDQHYKKFYIQLLENINLDDENVIHGLIQKLLGLRVENDKLIDNLWSQISNISDLKNGKFTSTNPNSLLYDTELTNSELRKMLKEQRLYNLELSKVLENYEKSITVILKTLIDSNISILQDLVDKFEDEFGKVEMNSEKMWTEWFKFNRLIVDIADLDDKIIGSLNGF